MFSFINRCILKLLLCFVWIFPVYGADVYITAFFEFRIEDLVAEYFLDVVYENSFCECQVNDGCTRGCRVVNDLDREIYLPVRKCTGKKPSRRSTDYCAKHVTGAIMTFIHSTLFVHCNSVPGEISQNAKNYTQCVDDFQEDVRNKNISICRHGFRFPSAFCFLNLDGQSFDLYNSISNRKIRRTCKNWDQYNQTLLNVDASVYYGEMTIIPMFKKIPFEKISSEKNGKQQVDTQKIPIGAIIVSESEFNNPNGHVEVKTDRNECGEDKMQTCFCSDFCRERLVYDKPVLAVFEWNPDFMKYIWDTFYWWEFPF